MPKSEMITGVVTTNKVGSECEFEVCERTEWEAMTGPQRDRRLIEAMWESGLVEVYTKEGE